MSTTCYDSNQLDLLAADYGAHHPRFASNIATKGIGHLVRKGTGGRSSVRFYSLTHILRFNLRLIGFETLLDPV